MRQAGVESVRAGVPCAGSARKAPLAQTAAEKQEVRSRTENTSGRSEREWECTLGKVGVPGEAAL
jgi:hypothetical protein